ncbi:MAG TPA: ParB/RepB/Spo0J family partition protein [Candidatus Fournierella merdipullorum]|uniref:ParB/RepB/Spo0J family partition protein n=1 Tax=Candidatus Allofournierella merdipullorum TaxID=2838595 RepID=A0A9D2E2Y8_9FIRM|nr:ParB/RepB/Spo0J family partition protein [Candidatus Fournierella merdipullorum]
MRNTGAEYTSSERTPTILPELAELLPPLSGEQFAALENDILQNGCYSPIIVNEDLVVIDGHNRQRICEQHGLPYRMAVFAFDDLLEAKQWALDTQKGRRNLDKWELGKIALRLKPEIEARAKANMSAGGGDQKSDAAKSGLTTLSNPIPTVNTRKELAGSVGIGEVTMGKVMQIDEHAPAAVKEALDKKELSVNQGYNITRQVQDLPEEEREQAALAAVEVEKAKKEIREKDAEIDRQSKIAGIFCKAFEKAVLLTPTEENVRIWARCTRMTREEMEDTVKESRELAGVFTSIADLMERILPERGTL